MPRISEFYGIVIWLYHNDHNPPHFHAEYGEHLVRIRLDTLKPMERGFPLRALRLVQEWAQLHRIELLANWHKARAAEPLDKIAPLP